MPIAVGCRNSNFMTTERRGFCACARRVRSTGAGEGRSGALAESGIAPGLWPA
ncbi:MAG: hypothetical protein ACLUIQ_11640 [Dialister invisus]